MKQQQQEINDINDKIVELYGKLVKIKHRLDELEPNDERNQSRLHPAAVEAKPINQVDTGKSLEQRNVQAGEWPNK
jgi:hypothetical protein